MGHTPVILATQDTAVGRLQIQDQLGQFRLCIKIKKNKRTRKQVSTCWI